MDRKKASALASLLMILLASFALVASVPPASAQPTGNFRYWIMGTSKGPSPGNVEIIDSLNEAPMEQGFWNFTIPTKFACQNITFSEPWSKAGYGQIVNLTVPAASYVGISHMLYDKTSTWWIKFSTTMDEDGHGWVFLNATGDVDCHTSSNNTGVYWRSPSPKAGDKAADLGELPSPGSDGVAGTADDGFGDGSPDSRGSSILLLPTKMRAEYHTGTFWQLLFEMTWPQAFTTGNASSIVIEPDSQINTANQSEVGGPWEFYAGQDTWSPDRPSEEKGPVPWGHHKSTAYVTYACAWSMLDISTTLGDYDLCFTIIEKKVREDCVIFDIDCNEEVDIFDIVKIGLSYGTTEANWGGDKQPYTGDDKITRDTKFDGRADVKSGPDDPNRGIIDLFDLVTCALDYGAKLTPNCTVRPF